MKVEILLHSQLDVINYYFQTSSMENQIIKIKSEADTIALAKKIAPLLRLGSVIALQGELGAGKTFFTQQLCKCLGVTENVSSPSYVLMNEYQGKYPIIHIDLYRLSSPEEVLELGFYDMMEHRITIIEWPEIALEFLPANTIYLTIKFVNGTREAEIIGL